MSLIAESLKKSSINIQGISKSLASTKTSISSLNDSVDNISKIISTNTRIKGELFARSKVLEARRLEASNRQEREDIVEASKASSNPKSAFINANRSDLNPFQRLLGFLGFVTAGWIAENLPTWIFMGNEFVYRIQSLGSAMYSMVNNTGAIMTAFGSTIKNSFNSLLTLNLSEFSDGSVAKSFDELNLAVTNLGNDIQETFKLFTTPLTESIETGEKAPGLGEDRPETMFPGIKQEEPPAGSAGQFTGQETTGGGKILNPQAAYSYLRQLGISHIHALGILANIKGESGFRIDSKQPDGPGIGLFQYSSTGRKQAFLQNVPDWKTNWKGQIKYAIGEDAGPSYLKTQFSSPEEAADWWMLKWERPSSAVYGERRRKHNDFVRTFKPSTSVQSSSSTSVPSSVISQKINPTVGDRLGAGRGHKGVDLQVEEGTPLRAISDGVIVDSDFEKNWGNFLVMKDNLGIYHLYGHMKSGYKRGGPVKKGEIIGRVGMTGRTTGPHLHWETGTGWNGGVITGIFDALTKYSKFAPFNTQPSTDVTSAQISTPSVNVPQSSTITPERKGSQIILIDDTRPQTPQVSYTPQQPSYTTTINESTLLNNFIKNKLLLDLAYL